MYSNEINEASRIKIRKTASQKGFCAIMLSRQLTFAYYVNLRTGSNVTPRYYMYVHEKGWNPLDYITIHVLERGPLAHDYNILVVKALL